MKSDNTTATLTVEVFAHLDSESGTAFWETRSILITGIDGSIWFSKEELELLTAAIEEIAPKEKEMWHQMKFDRICESGGLLEPNDEYYSLDQMFVLREVTCSQCGALLSKKDQEGVEVHGVDPFCSLYCANVASGVPMPASRGALVFDRIFNQSQ